MKALAQDVVKLFVEAGWTPDRRANLTTPPPDNHPAAELLSAFGGLRISATGPGTQCAASDVYFTQQVDELPEALAFARLLGEPLVPLAETHNAHGVLYIGQSGRCFGASLIDETIWLEGESFEEAIRSLTTGRRVRPILLPGQESAALYGETYALGDPRLYGIGDDSREV
jgi:hypothetical protein